MDSPCALRRDLGRAIRLDDRRRQGYAARMTRRLSLAIFALSLSAFASAAHAADGAPLAYWPFDGDLADASAGGVALMSPYKKLEYVAGVAGQAIAFTWEKRDYLRTPKPAQLPLEGDFTVSGWFKAEMGPTRNSVQGLISRWAYDGKAQFDLALHGQKLAALLTTDGAKPIELKHPTLVDFEIWYYLAFTYHAESKTAALYLALKDEPSLDDAATKVLDAPLHVQEETALTIGFSQLGGRFYNGAIDEVVIWSRALSSKELAEIFARGKAGQPALGGKR